MTYNIVDVEIKTFELLMFLLKGEITMHSNLEGGEGSAYFEDRIDKSFAKLDEIKSLINSVSKYIDESVAEMKTNDNAGGNAGGGLSHEYKIRYNEDRAMIGKMLRKLKGSNFMYEMYKSGFQEFESEVVDDGTRKVYNHETETYDVVKDDKVYPRAKRDAFFDQPRASNF